MTRLTTGYRWHTLLTEVTTNVENCSNDSPLDLSSDLGPNGCAEVAGYIFIPCFIIVSRLVLLNLITVLVINGYLESRKLENMIFTEAEIDRLLKTWAIYDSDRSGLMRCEDFILFLYRMPEPFGTSMYERPIQPKDIAYRFIESKDNTIIITIKTLLEITKHYPLPIYEIKNEYYVHYVDYISFITNKSQLGSKFSTK